MKVDGRGRLRYTAEQRTSLLNAYDASGLSGPKFAALHGVKYQTFAVWRNTRTHPGALPKHPASNPSTFIEVEARSRDRADPERLIRPGRFRARWLGVGAGAFDGVAAAVANPCARCLGPRLRESVPAGNYSVNLALGDAPFFEPLAWGG